jgi:thiol:disulfide interchange protein DsbD
MRNRGFYWLVLAVATLFCGLSGGAASVGADSSHLRVELIAPSTLVRGAQAQAGLHFRMESGWHVYWQNAGDAGEPPRVSWKMPAGITADALEFPPPTRLPLGPLMDFGYEREVVFPFALHVAANAETGNAVLAARVNWLVCREVCLPGHADLTLNESITASGSATGLTPDENARLGSAVASLPSAAPASLHTAFQATPTGYRLAILTGHREASAIFFPTQTGVIENAAPQAVSPVTDGVVLTLKKDSTLTTIPTALSGLVELSDGRSYLFTAHPGPVPAVVEHQPAEWGKLAQQAGLAFLGGMILNLMPCVFPVLFLKGLSLVNSAGEERVHIRRHGLVYTLGIVASFWLLVALLLALRAAGATLGWGFQFQSPIFVALMAAFLFFLGLSLAGQFEIGLSLTSAGGSLAQKQGYAGSFFTGVLAVVVATPCTAPLMGAAIGYALAQSAAASFVVFTALGLGLAAPYLLLTLQPSWTRLLPRPGAWMEVLKQATSVPIFATVIWLVWVMAQTRGATGVAVLLATLLLLAISGWVLGRWPARRGPELVATAILLVAVGFCVYGVNTLAMPVSAAEESNSGWKPWSQAAVEQARAAEEPVFVDFTASWCLSCQVNERVVLRAAEVRAAFAQKHVALFKADWTTHDDAITQALAALGRSGVPTYVLYAPGTGSAGTVLPEVLTPGIVLDALKKLP